MIRSRKELQFYLEADLMMNYGHFKPTLADHLKNFFSPNVVTFLRCLRRTEYYTSQRGWGNKFISVLYKQRLKKLSIIFGFSISPNSFGYGLYLPHWGTVVIGGSNRIGNYALINVGTCITDSRSSIGDAFFMGTGSVISKRVELGSNICLGANSVLLKDFTEGNVTMAGVPAKEVKFDNEPWYKRLWPGWEERVNKIEFLKLSMGL